MLKLNDGRAELYQWDTGRTATVAVECDEVHFSHMKFGEAVNVKVIDGQVQIPNELLRLGLDVYCWAFVRTKAGGYTRVKKRFDVKKRPKPADYITTPDEQATWTELESRIEALENGGGGSGGGGTNTEELAERLTAVEESYFDKANIVHTEGVSKSKVMSQYGVMVLHNAINGDIEGLDGRLTVLENNAYPYEISQDVGFELGGANATNAESNTTMKIRTPNMAPMPVRVTAGEGVTVRVYYYWRSDSVSGYTSTADTRHVINGGSSAELVIPDGATVMRVVAEYLPLVEITDIPALVSKIKIETKTPLAHWGEGQNERFPMAQKAITDFVNGKVGDIETALDGILAIQTALIGGDGA